MQRFLHNCVYRLGFLTRVRFSLRWTGVSLALDVI